MLSEEVRSIFEWVNLIKLYVGRNRNNTLRFESFQKRMIMQAVYFIAKIKCPRMEKDLTLVLNHIFDVTDFESIDQRSVVDSNQNKIAAAVVPRRHGKSFIVSIILASCLLSIRCVTLSYISPIFKLNSDKFDEVSSILREMNSLTEHAIDPQMIVANKQTKTISVYHDGLKQAASSLSFVCCHNENVSWASFFGYSLAISLLLLLLLLFHPSLNRLRAGGMMSSFV